MKTPTKYRTTVEWLSELGTQDARETIRVRLTDLPGYLKCTTVRVRTPKRKEVEVDHQQQQSG